VISESDLEFLNAVWTRRPIFTYIFFGINIAVFLLMTLAGGTTNEATLIAFGVKSNVLIDNGEYWRFVTPIFIHIGLLHLFFNSYALWLVGPQVEKLYGGARFVILYVLTGVAGVVGSYLYRPDGLSAGASGAIFGLFGVLLVFGIRYRRNVPPFFRRAVGTGVVPVIVINLIIGFTIPAIDNSAHISGLLAGMALAAVVPFEHPRSKTPAIYRSLQVALLTIIAGSAYEVLRHYDGPGLTFQNVYRGGLGGGRSTTEDFIDVINGAQTAFSNSVQALDRESKTEIQSSMGDVATAIDKLKEVPSLGSKADDLTSQLLTLMQDQYELLQEVDRSGTMTLMHDRRATQNANRYREVSDAFLAWVDAEGARFGIQLRKPRETVK
jgi:rhomboid protease GluP